jgi:glutathione S-transferase
MAARFVLYGFFRSGPTYKVALALALSGEAYAYESVALRDGQHKTPEFLAKNRFGQVPALEDRSNGMVLCQSAAILDYLADKTGKLGGATLLERIQAREWCLWDFDRLALNIYRPRAVKLGIRQMDPAVVAQYETEGKAALQVLDDWLRGRNWLVGEHPTFADVDVYGVVVYAPDGGYDLSAYPNIGDWMKRFEALPGYGTREQLLPQESRSA